MAVSNIKDTFQCNTKKAWETVTSLEKCTWRSDLSKIEILNHKQFIEYTKDGYATTFTITATDPYKRWEFDMENNNMKGHWIGVFTPKGTQTEVDFTEDVTAKKFFMKPFVKGYLKKQQTQYIEDLNYHPLLFYVIFGASGEELSVSRKRHHVDAFPDGLNLISI